MHLIEGNNMNNDSFNKSARALASSDRGAEVSEWFKDKLPEVNSVLDVRTMPMPGSTVKRVLFSEGQWMTNEAVYEWRTNSTNSPYFNPSSQVSLERPMDSWELQELNQDNLELEALLDLAKKEISKYVDIKITRIFRPGDSANGVVSGKILAVSEHYSAQSIGNADILVHANQSLNRMVEPGEYVTFEYTDGKATVFNGCLFDIKIDSDSIDDAQKSYLRKRIQDALSTFETAAATDSALVKASKWAIVETIKKFNLEENSLKINKLEVEDTYSRPQIPCPSSKFRP